MRCEGCFEEGSVGEGEGEEGGGSDLRRSGTRTSTSEERTWRLIIGYKSIYVCVPRCSRGVAEKE